MAINWKKTFDEVFVAPDYALTTLINGNVTECISYLRDLIATGATGSQEAHEQLVKICEADPTRYRYILSKVFAA